MTMRAARVFAALSLALPLTAQGEELFEILDAYDSLNTKDLPCVAVVTKQGDKVVREYGFQIAHDGRRATVQLLNLNRITITLGKPAANGETTTLEPIVLTELVPLYIERVLDNRFRFATPTKPMSPQAESLVLARALARAGWHWRAKELLSAIEDGHRALRESLAYRLVRDRADPRLSWQNLLERHDAWLEAFSQDARYIQEAREGIASTIEKIKRGDYTPIQLALLNDLWLDGNMESQASTVRPLNARPDDGNSPITTIDKLGLAAAPELIELLASEEPCRAAYCRRRRTSHSTPITMKHQAHAALERVMGGPLPNGSGNRQQVWQDLYAETKKIGARAMLERRASQLELIMVHRLLKASPDSLAIVLERLESGDQYAKDRGYPCVRWLLQHKALRKRADVQHACAAYCEVAKPHVALHVWLQLDNAGYARSPQLLARHIQSLDLQALPCTTGVESNRFRSLMRRCLLHAAPESWQALAHTSTHASGRYWLARSLLYDDSLVGARAALESTNENAREQLLQTIEQLLQCDETLAPEHYLDLANKYGDLATIRIGTIASHVLHELWPETFFFNWPHNEATQQQLLRTMRKQFADHRDELR